MKKCVCPNTQAMFIYQLPAVVNSFPQEASQALCESPFLLLCLYKMGTIINPNDYDITNNRKTEYSTKVSTIGIFKSLIKSLSV